jgi:hypothetical protein
MLFTDEPIPGGIACLTQAFTCANIWSKNNLASTIFWAEPQYSHLTISSVGLTDKGAEQDLHRRETILSVLG